MMIDLAKSGFIDLILTKSISRFARSVVDTLSILNELKQCGVEVWFENENISSFDSKIEFVISVLSGMAEEEARNVSENVKWNVRKRFSEGKFYLVTKGFLGYTKDASGNYVIDESEAAVVREIYKRYLAGEGVSKIVTYLNEQGIPTTYNKGKWYENAVYNILKNEKYTGNAMLQKTMRPSFKSKTKVNNTTLPKYYVEESHPPIIDIEIFEKAQERRLLHTRKYHYPDSSLKRNKYSTKTRYAGLVHCSSCGKAYIHRKGASTSEYSKAFLMCPSNKSKKQCPSERLSLTVLNQVVFNQIKQLLSNKADFLKQIELAVERNPKRVALVEKLSQLQGELESLRQNQSQLLGEEDSFHQVVNRELEVKQTQLQIEIASIQTILHAKYHPKQTKDKVQAIINQYQQDKDVDPLLKNLVESITLVDPQRLELRLKVESEQVTPIYLQEVVYPIRKKEKRFEHCIML